MYASKDDITLGILNPEKLSQNLKNQIEDLGFTPLTTGREAGAYVFTSQGDTGLHANQPAPTNTITTVGSGGSDEKVSTDKLAKSVPQDQRRSWNWLKVFTTPKDVDEFPKGIEKTEFFKRAESDGWVFVDRNELGEVPKGATLKVISIKNLNIINTLDYNKIKSSLKENMKKSELRKIIRDIIKEEAKPKHPLIEKGAPHHGAGKEAKRDVTAIHRLLTRVIDTRDEYGQTLIDVLQHDVAGKGVAIRNAFRELSPEMGTNLQSLANLILKHFGDEKDTYQSFAHGEKDYEIDSEEAPKEIPTGGEEKADTPDVSDKDIEKGFEDEEI
jgi:hypothetical protein